jgi:hypothetical protein
MGKGGESDVNTKKTFKLASLSDDALQKWASAYGVKTTKNSNRDALLEALVC